ncbi:MAG: arginine--tRNA ligase [Candidatus Pacebacteria bacterium]|nr:arginine--tRNA ligase [Candidatus Paceibacterota bacterium]
MIQNKLKQIINEALKNLGIQAESILLEHPGDFKMGDYSTNVAMALAKVAKSNPKELAEKICDEINKNKISEIEKVEAKNGFINFFLSKEFFGQSIKDIDENFGKNDLLKGKKIMVEYTDPNPFKPFHIGHLMSNAIGESISRIVQFSGANTVRANYQGDIGLHVAKSIYGLLQKGQPDLSLPIGEQAEYIGTCYSFASNLYEENENIKKEINEINKKLYSKEDKEINDLYDWGRRVTLVAFEEIYKMLGTKFQHYFFESEMAPIGINIVKENTGKVFEESDGAVVFKADKYDPKLHTRVFINSQGLPTYETKEIGLTYTKFEKENPDLSIVITANEQGEYMKVVQKALSIINPDYEKRMKHIVHGMMRFAEGKMSSRKGNVITGESLLRDAKILVLEKMKERDFEESMKEKVSSVVAVSALKYSILKQALGADIIYDFEKSISFEGDSGPYLQYATVRASSLIEKAKNAGIKADAKLSENWETTVLEKYLYRFPEVVERAYQNLEPHHIATYITELASTFNLFYADHKIVDENDITSPYRIALTSAFYITMKNGLYLLGIQTPEKM